MLILGLDVVWLGSAHMWSQGEQSALAVACLSVLVRCCGLDRVVFAQRL